MKIGLFFGSFNPIHTGHLIIAQYIHEYAELDKTWFVVSPQNPLKPRNTLAHEQDRYEMVSAAIYDNYDFVASDIEFHMPKPSFTIDTLTYLFEKHPEHEFHLIMGSDNLNHFHKWKNYQSIIENFSVIVYPRPGNHTIEKDKYPQFNYLDAPLIDISATQIRRMLLEGRSVKYLLPEPVQGYIKSKKLFEI